MSISAAQTRRAGECSALTTLQSQSPLGTPSPAQANTLITLGGSGNIRFFSDPGCTAAITSQMMNAGASTIGFYWKATVAGNQYLYGSAPFFIGHSQFNTIQPAEAVAVAFGSQFQTIPAGVCASSPPRAARMRLATRLSWRSPLPSP